MFDITCIPVQILHVLSLLVYLVPNLLGHKASKRHTSTWPEEVDLFSKEHTFQPCVQRKVEGADHIPCLLTTHTTGEENRGAVFQ